MTVVGEKTRRIFQIIQGECRVKKVDVSHTIGILRANDEGIFGELVRCIINESPMC